MKDNSLMYRKILSVVLIIGMLIAVYLTYEHFSHGSSGFCDFGASFDCGIVNKSPYANADGIFYLLVIDWNWPLPLIDLSGKNIILDFITSNAVLGFLTLLFLLLLNIRHKKEQTLFVPREKNVRWIRGILIFGVLYGAYLYYIQHAILKTYCAFCIGLDVILITSLVLAYKIKE